MVHQCELNGFHLVPITLAHIGLVELLPFHHRDPFDRLLVAQARIEGMTLVFRDPALKNYGISTDGPSGTNATSGLHGGRDAEGAAAVRKLDVHARVPAAARSVRSLRPAWIHGKKLVITARTPIRV